MTNVLLASASGVWLADSSRAGFEGLEDERITALAAHPVYTLTGAFLRNGL